MIQFQENTETDDRRDGWKDLFHRIPLPITGGITSTAAVDWHSKVKDIEYKCLFNETLLYHSLHAKNRLNS